MDFDYSLHKVVGVAEGNTHNENAIIKPVGYLNQSWDFIPFTEQEIEETFPSRGFIFAYKFKLHQPNLVGKGIYLGIQPANNSGKDAYVWDFNNGVPDEYVTVIKRLTSNIFTSSTPDSIYEFCNNKRWFDISSKTYRFHDDVVYCIDPKDISKRYIRCWNLEVLRKNIEFYSTLDKKYYIYLGANIEEPATYIDIMPDIELNEWLLDKFLIPEWSDILSNNNVDSIKDSLKKVILKCQWPEEIITIRMNRILQSLNSIVFTTDQIKKFINYPNLQNVLNESIKNCSETRLKKLNSTYAEEIKELQKIHIEEINKEKEIVELQISEIHKNIEDVKDNYNHHISEYQQKETVLKDNIKKLERITVSRQDEIDLLEKKIENLRNKKNSVLEDFEIVKDVLNLMNTHNTMSTTPNLQTIQDRNAYFETITDETNPLENGGMFVKRLETTLLQNNRNSVIAKKILGYLVHYETLVVPDARIVLSILKATGKCNYIIQYVTPEWRSFDKVWENGLSAIVDKSNDDPNVINYFILQNVNLTYIPCILQPIVDISLGLRNSFPNTQINFPRNLRIILTITEEEGLPLAIQNIKYFGCLKKGDYTIDENMEREKKDVEISCKGYLSMGIIESMGFIPSPSSEFKSYISNYDE